MTMAMATVKSTLTTSGGVVQWCGIVPISVRPLGH